MLSDVKHTIRRNHGKPGFSECRRRESNPHSQKENWILSPARSTRNKIDLSPCQIGVRNSVYFAVTIVLGLKRNQGSLEGKWHAWQDSNPRLAVPETGSCVHPNVTKNIPLHTFILPHTSSVTSTRGNPISNLPIFMKSLTCRISGERI